MDLEKLLTEVKRKSTKWGRVERGVSGGKNS
jgi:hypothetical protein